MPYRSNNRNLDLAQDSRSSRIKRFYYNAKEHIRENMRGYPTLWATLILFLSVGAFVSLLTLAIVYGIDKSNAREMRGYNARVTQYQRHLNVPISNITCWVGGDLKFNGVVYEKCAVLVENQVRMYYCTPRECVRGAN